MVVHATRYLLIGALVATSTTAVAPADARPRVRKHSDPAKRGAVARVAFGRELRSVSPVVGRRSRGPLTDEEAAAANIQKLLRTTVLRRGITGLFVADARTGEPLFAVNADDPLNPASNVKMISTATSIDLLGPEFRYPTRVLGPDAVGGVIHGDVYLLGSYDPTLAIGDFDEIAAGLEARGVTEIDGNVLSGGDPTRDGLYRAVIPIEISAEEPGEPALVTAPPGLGFVQIENKATTGRSRWSRLHYKIEQLTVDPKPAPAADPKSPAPAVAPAITDPPATPTDTLAVPTGPRPRMKLTITGTIGRGRTTHYRMWATKQRRAAAAYALMAALRAHQIKLTGNWKTVELGDYIGDSITRGVLPTELAGHLSEPVADIVRHINKRSINWLADRLVVTATALTRAHEPSMESAIDEMYAWLDRRAHLATKDVVLDTGSGLSYRTAISPHELVAVIRSAAGFNHAQPDPNACDAWLDSLSIAGTDGTLRGRFRGHPQSRIRGKLIGKTGTLSTVIALSGILDLDPDRPLVFSLVTNTDSPLPKRSVRRAHERVIGVIASYLAETRHAHASARPTSPGRVRVPDPEPTESEGDESSDDESSEPAPFPFTIAPS